MFDSKVDYYYDELSKARKRIGVLERRTHRLLYLAKVERGHFIGVSEEWEDERDRYQDMMEQRDEAVVRLLYHKNKHEQGAPMTIAGMKMRIAELKERNERLIVACRDARTAIQVIENKPAFYYSELMVLLAEISDTLYDHIAREESR